VSNLIIEYIVGVTAVTLWCNTVICQERKNRFKTWQKPKKQAVSFARAGDSVLGVFEGIVGGFLISCLSYFMNFINLLSDVANFTKLYGLSRFILFFGEK
jgi:hypothetical protein